MNKFELKINELDDNIKCFYYLIQDYIDGKYENKKEVLIPLIYHIKICDKCKNEIIKYQKYKNDNKNIIEIQDSFFNEFKEQLQKTKKKEIPSELKEGQVWGMPGFPEYITYQKNLSDKVLPYSLEPRPLLIYKIDKKNEEIFGFPINFEYIQFASDFDLIISKEQSELNLEYMIEVWNPVTTSADLLGKNYWGTVSEKIMDDLETLTLEYNGFEVKDANSDIVTGRPIKLENDLRNRFQEIERKATEVLSAPYIEKMEFEEYISEQEKIEAFLKVSIISKIILFTSKYRITQKVAGAPERFIYKKTIELFDNKYEMDISANDNTENYTLNFDFINSNTGEKCNNFEISILELEEQGDFDDEKSKELYRSALLSGREIKKLAFYNKEYYLDIKKECNIALVIKDINNEKDGAPELIFLNMENNDNRDN